MMRSLFLSILPFLSGVFAASRTSAPEGCITVGSGGPYSTVQSAVDSLSNTTTEAQCIFISPGTYNEQVLIPARNAQLTVYGYTTDTTSYEFNEATITYNLSQANSPGFNNDMIGSLRIKADGFKMYNVNVVNTYGKGSQGIALSAQSNAGYYGCQFIGYQDTLLANAGTQLYSKCMIIGVTDFIFGREAPAWFENCDIRTLASTRGYVTANGRRYDNGTSFYVFNNCDVAAAPNNTVPAGAFYLGRPWGAYARVVFQNSSLSPVINSTGWRTWNAGDERIDNVLLGEYANTGLGATGARANFSTQLTEPVAISTILGANYTSQAWFDASYM